MTTTAKGVTPEMADDLIERLRAQDGKETAAQIEAEVTARLDPRALVAAKEAFRAFHASWDGSISVAICAYLDALTSKDAALSEIRAELERWQANWDANVQEMSEKFRAVNLAQVMAGTNLDLLARAEAAESQLDMARKALEPFARAARMFDNVSKAIQTEPRPDNCVAQFSFTHGELRAAARALAEGETKSNPDQE